MSAGNGKTDDIEITLRECLQIERLASLVDRGVGVVSQRYPATTTLSARERSEQMDALIEQVDALAKQHNALVKAVDGMMAQARAMLLRIGTVESTAERRLDAIERGAAILSAWVRRPFWERVRSRLGF